MSERPPDDATIDAAVTSDDVDDRAYRVKLPMFEGPLDLLLHLIQKHELNILDIPIGFVAQKYVEYIRLMEEMSIDIASEYLVMAATLAHLKSRSLLPPDPTQESEETTEEEEEDPRAELIRRLLEYQKYKHAADTLGQREVLGRDVFQRGFATEQSDEEAPLAPMSLFKLVDAFENVLKRAKQVEEHHIDFEKVSISDRIGQIVERLRTARTLSFEQLFDGDVTRAEMIVTFLALLEMTKLRMTRLAQDGPLAPIVVELVLTADQAQNFQVEKAFEQVLEAVEQDFSPAKRDRSAEEPAMPLTSWEENEIAELDQLSDEELAQELREAAKAFALGDQEAHPPAPLGGASRAPDEPGSDQLGTFGPPEEDDFEDDVADEEDVRAGYLALKSLLDTDEDPYGAEDGAEEPVGTNLEPPAKEAQFREVGSEHLVDPVIHEPTAGADESADAETPSSPDPGVAGEVEDPEEGGADPLSEATGESEDPAPPALSGAPSTEPETKDDNEDAQEGSQDRDGSDVESR